MGKEAEEALYKGFLGFYLEMGGRTRNPCFLFADELKCGGVVGLSGQVR